ncbi:MAG: hypothetical protein LBQ64_03995 [Bacteroidales bacterium]|jgi:hypothetical protein|nr:hypothetical protein [Bacteroidales bacterium]
MANPIKETPVLYGEDARRFAERIENPIPETPERMEEMRQNYASFLEALERGRSRKKAGKNWLTGELS